MELLRCPFNSGLPRWLSGKEFSYQCRRCRFNPWIGRSPERGNGKPVFLPGKSHGQRSLEGYSPWVCKESDTTEHTCTRHLHLCSGLRPYLLEHIVSPMKSPILSATFPLLLSSSSPLINMLELQVHLLLYKQGYRWERGWGSETNKTRSVP